MFEGSVYPTLQALLARHRRLLVPTRFERSNDLRGRQSALFVPSVGVVDVWRGRRQARQGCTETGDTAETTKPTAPAPTKAAAEERRPWIQGSTRERRQDERRGVRLPAKMCNHIPERRAVELHRGVEQANLVYGVFHVVRERARAEPRRVGDVASSLANLKGRRNRPARRCPSHLHDAEQRLVPLPSCTAAAAAQKIEGTLRELVAEPLRPDRHQRHASVATARETYSTFAASCHRLRRRVIAAVLRPDHELGRLRMLWMRLLLLLLTAVAAVAVVVCGLKGLLRFSGVG